MHVVNAKYSKDVRDTEIMHRRRKSHPGPRQAPCVQLFDQIWQDIFELLAFEDIREFYGPWPCRCNTDISVVCWKNRRRWVDSRIRQE